MQRLINVSHIIDSLLLRVRHYIAHIKLMLKTSLLLTKYHLLNANSKSFRSLLKAVTEPEYRWSLLKELAIRRCLSSKKLHVEGLHCKLNYMGKELTLKLLRYDDIAIIWEIFFEGEYAPLNVKDKCVVDIGAYIGDSSIYFAVKGAKKVVAVEPDDAAFDVLGYNIEINNFRELIEPIKMRVLSPKDLEVLISSYYYNEPIVLKVDCEGCEYDLFLHDIREVKKILECVEEMIIEYHGWSNNPCRLICTLKSIGYTVSIKPKSRRSGIIYAKRNTSA